VTRTLPPARPQVHDFFGAPPVIEPSPGQPSGDAGLLPVRPFDQRIALSRAFADSLDDPCDPDLLEGEPVPQPKKRLPAILR
jgi:hypothetical protein